MHVRMYVVAFTTVIYTDTCTKYPHDTYIPIPKIIHTAAVAIPYTLFRIWARITHNLYRTTSMIITLSRMFEHFNQPAEIPIEKKKHLNNFTQMQTKTQFDD